MTEPLFTFQCIDFTERIRIQFEIRVEIKNAFSEFTLFDSNIVPVG